MEKKRKRPPGQPDIADFLKKKQPRDQPERAEFTEAKKPKTEEAPGKKHSIQFHLEEDLFQVDCTDRMMVLEALSTHDVFNAKKEKGNVVVARKDDAVVSTHFPCCLIDSQEELTVGFISGPSQNEIPKKEVHEKEELVAFNVETRGKKGVINILKNKELANSHSYVCVYGVKGQKLSEALREDGRFVESIFEKNIELKKVGGNQKTFLMSNKVDKLKDNVFKITAGKGNRKKKAQAEGKDPGEKQTGSQVSNGPSVASTSSPGPQAENTDPRQDSANAQPLKPKRIQVKEIPDTEEVLNLLRGQFAGLLKQLKERESLAKPVEVQRFFREEYDKSAQSFSEVKRVKDLMKLSDSVCLVCVEGSPRGTGFLLFGRFVLTNAHVVEKDVDPEMRTLLRAVTAVFGYESLGSGKASTVKADVVAYRKGENEKGQHLDFALLELSDEAKLDCPELLSTYSPPPIRGGICIVGHPDGGVKRMDPCFIIEKGEIPRAVDRHLAENSSFLNVITQQYFTDKWEYNNSQISYDSCFFHGSSGSPVFNEHCQLIGVHTGGYVYKGEGGRTRSVMEYAVPMFPILVSIVRQSRQKNRSDIIQYFEDQNNMKRVLQVANEQNQENQQVS